MSDLTYIADAMHDYLRAQDAKKEAKARLLRIAAETAPTDVYRNCHAQAKDLEDLAERMGQKPVAWEHHYRKITGGRSYVQADCGGPDIHPDPDEGYEWLRATPLYAAPQPTPEDVRDAGRWRELRDGYCGMGDHHLVLARMYHDPLELRCEVADYDAAIDAAMQQEQPK